MEWSWSSLEEAVSCGEVWRYPPQPPPYRQDQYHVIKQQGHTTLNTLVLYSM